MTPRHAAITAAALLLAAMQAFNACGGSASVLAQRGQVSDPPDPPADLGSDHKPLRILRGLASYYSDRLAGRKTSSGERYDPKRRTAASRDLPMGSVVRVIRPDTGAQVIVRINDRGPFGDRRRILDLSRAAAQQLGMLDRGLVRVRAEVLELGKPRRRVKR
jgi:rare lipoprotein A